TCCGSALGYNILAGHRGRRGLLQPFGWPSARLRGTRRRPADAIERRAGRGHALVYRLLGGGCAAQHVNFLCVDREGRLWVGANGGLFLLEEAKVRGAFQGREVIDAV